MAKLIFTHKKCFSYRAETLLLSVCKPKYGNIFSNSKKREQFLEDWFSSRQFKASNVTQLEFETMVDECRSYESLLIRFLELMAEKSRSFIIVDSTPSNAYHIARIKQIAPHSKFIFMIRDGRNVAISKNKLGWSNPPFPFTSYESNLHYSVLQWRDLLLRGDRQMERNSGILKIRYEDLVNKPAAVIDLLSKHLSIEPSTLDASALKDYNSSNSAFGKLGETHSNNDPMLRWKTLNDDLIFNISYGCLDTLAKYGYEVPQKQFVPILAIRSLYFKIHIKLKHAAVHLPFIGRSISSSLEKLD